MPGRSKASSPRPAMTTSSEGRDIQRERRASRFSPVVTMLRQLTNVVAPVQPSFIRQHPNSAGITHSARLGDVMERRHFLKVAIGFAAGAATLAAAAHAAPLSLHPLVPDRGPPLENDAQPAVTSEAEVEQLKPEQVRHGHGHGHHYGWGRGHHYGWHHRHWGWRRRHWGWRRRHWGWRRRHWRRRYY
jgi:hypothetical protein